jgi:hypothetical protein
MITLYYLVHYKIRMCVVQWRFGMLKLCLYYIQQGTEFISMASTAKHIHCIVCLALYAVKLI